MRYANGRVTSIEDGKALIEVNVDEEALKALESKKAYVCFVDGRQATEKQKEYIRTLLRDLAEWTGYEENEFQTIIKRAVLYSMEECRKSETLRIEELDYTVARRYINVLIGLCLRLGAYASFPLSLACDASDLNGYIYSCLYRKTCCVCGKHADLHHVDRVGAGRDREHMNHLGMRCLPLCRTHHNEAHQHGDDQLMKKYNLIAVPINVKVAKTYGLGMKDE